MPALQADLTTARITAFSPGASPPPVRTPMRLMSGTRRYGRKFGGRQGDRTPDLRIANAALSQLS